MKCRKCEQKSQVMVRVNQKGVTGVWECSPCCDVPFISNEAALLYTLTLEENEEKNQDD